jgi:Concanavalin A-like lectin/glucanases superfamily
VIGIINVNKWEIWIDGKKENFITTLTANPTLNNTETLYLGDLIIAGSTSNQFIGQLDNIKIYNQVHYPSEINGILSCPPTFKINFDGALVDQGTTPETINNSGATPTIGRDGINNTAYKFDGFKYLDAGKSSRSITDELTVSAWFKTSSTKSRQFIVSQYDANLDVGYHLVVIGANDNVYQTDTVALGGRDRGNKYHISASSKGGFNDGKWHYIVGVIKDKKWEVWVDGNLEGSYISTTSTPSIGSTNTLYIGDFYEQSGEFMGDLDDITIKNCAERPSLITSIYNSKTFVDLSETTIYPNPLINGEISISTKNTIEEVIVTNSAGLQERYKTSNFKTTLKGLLLVQINYNNGTSSIQKVIAN